MHEKVFGVEFLKMFKTYYKIFRLTIYSVVGIRLIFRV